MEAAARVGAAGAIDGGNCRSTCASKKPRMQECCASFPPFVPMHSYRDGEDVKRVRRALHALRFVTLVRAPHAPK